MQNKERPIICLILVVSLQVTSAHLFPVQLMCSPVSKLSFVSRCILESQRQVGLWQSKCVRVRLFLLLVGSGPSHCGAGPASHARPRSHGTPNYCSRPRHGNDPAHCAPLWLWFPADMRSSIESRVSSSAARVEVVVIYRGKGDAADGPQEWRSVDIALLSLQQIMSHEIRANGVEEPYPVL